MSKKTTRRRANSNTLSKHGEPNWKNRTLFHGDNLNFLRAMNSESVHLIATDPPFNKGRDFHATPTSLESGASFQDRWRWDDDVHPEWVDQITDDFPKVMNVIQGSRGSYGDNMGAFLCFMAVRLVEMHRVLREDGSIYLHCDPTASHYLKELMDSIFGIKNFRNEIIWCYGAGGSSKKNFPKKHDTIFRYSKSSEWTFNSTNKLLRVPYSQITLDMHYKHEDEDGRRYRIQKGKYKTYADEGKLIPDYWTDIGGQRATSPIMKESANYPTQKPLALYERIISASSNKGDIVLDPFAGCATTCIAAEKLGRQWVGIDIWNKVENVVLKRLEEERLKAPKYARRKKALANELLFAEDIHLTSKLPVRTDDGLKAVPFLKTTLRVDEPKGEKMSRAKMVEVLVERYGLICRGCDRKFDDPRYLELDHNTPRSDGGLNHISNRILLCTPCNRLKSNTYTLSGLRKENKKLGYMQNKS